VAYNVEEHEATPAGHAIHELNDKKYPLLHNVATFVAVQEVAPVGHIMQDPPIKEKPKLHPVGVA